jgi:hypothetical protein
MKYIWDVRKKIISHSATNRSLQKKKIDTPIPPTHLHTIKFQIHNWICETLCWSHKSNDKFKNEMGRNIISIQ